jgi:hypothetical protein
LGSFLPVALCLGRRGLYQTELIKGAVSATAAASAIVVIGKVGDGTCAKKRGKVIVHLTIFNHAEGPFVDIKLSWREGRSSALLLISP